MQEMPSMAAPGTRSYDLVPHRAGVSGRRRPSWSPSDEERGARGDSAVNLLVYAPSANLVCHTAAKLFSLNFWS